MYKIAKFFREVGRPFEHVREYREKIPDTCYEKRNELLVNKERRDFFGCPPAFSLFFSVSAFSLLDLKVLGNNNITTSSRYLVMIASLGGSIHAPMKSTTFSCRVFRNVPTWNLKAFNCSSVGFSISMILTATSPCQ